LEDGLEELTDFIDLQLSRTIGEPTPIDDYRLVRGSKHDFGTVKLESPLNKERTKRITFYYMSNKVDVQEINYYILRICHLPDSLIVKCPLPNLSQSMPKITVSRYKNKLDLENNKPVEEGSFLNDSKTLEIEILPTDFNAIYKIEWTV
jgi:hypothetical protein